MISSQMFDMKAKYSEPVLDEPTVVVKSPTGDNKWK
jgi:hypothetical protein